ncbi:spore gernimation protein [Paenibacillus psychroresistens]|uniref:Spore gernimation protein n=1 Tax=Paenibacillus psychroresistens TaxID=1778678 RepID=A0A6B8RLA0_9BACL|nr:GerAB/ArcD/ProY family transporter [Paenibacillus psychroresistens]QGQ96148.1 spore gernimation protein [Paenibacillus psychroresistens]
MENKISDKYNISPFMVFFLLYASMVEVGVLNYQRILVNHAGYNAWISIVITGISIHLIVWMIYKIISSNEASIDLVAINSICFGAFTGKILNIAIILYFFFGAFITFRGHVAVIQVWLFPAMPILPISLIIAVLIYYTISGGFRSITGISFWGTIASIICILPLPFLILRYLHPQNLLPLVNHSLADLLLSSKSMVFQYLGIEALLMFHPFIQAPAKSQKWAHLAVFSATFLYLSFGLATFMYYSEDQLLLNIWPTMHIIMILAVPLFQRLELFIVSVLFITMLASISLGLWVACRGAKNSLHIKQPLSLIAFLIGFLILEALIKDYNTIKQLTAYYTTVGFYFIYVYIPLIFVIMQIRKKWRKRLKSQSKPENAF